MESNFPEYTARIYPLGDVDAYNKKINARRSLIVVCAHVVRGVCTLRLHMFTNTAVLAQWYGTFLRPSG